MYKMKEKILAKSEKKKGYAIEALSTSNELRFTWKVT